MTLHHWVSSLRYSIKTPIIVYPVTRSHIPEERNPKKVFSNYTESIQHVLSICLKGFNILNINACHLVCLVSVIKTNYKRSQGSRKSCRLLKVLRHVIFWLKLEDSDIRTHLRSLAEQYESVLHTPYFVSTWKHAFHCIIFKILIPTSRKILGINYTVQHWDSC